ncbi:hypothetical protein VW23_021660 [Devosia insulae DS-56]|uniref:Ribonuclease VapC n=1 Tax=Devosia insulae DS-56 TaxID=1116389 RepID=A0A1E5XP46_9HYPH|nr:type II toxin-antitoxin system VapC family toxin [Devosia insulae]OEO30377.1 hypothetical protein VW23_021660 [Devosia insulae DS-56]
MIVLDTNVVSEPMRPRPDMRVVDWLDAQDPAELWLTVVTVAELRTGIAKLGSGPKRSLLVEQVEATLADFEDRILPFDADAALIYGELAGPMVAQKVTFAPLDVQLAAISLVHGATLATRNVKQVTDFGVPFVNPWDV